MSVLSRLTARLGSALQSLITAPARIYQKANIRQKLAYGSAAVLAFLFAPAVAVSLSQDEPVETHHSVQTTVTVPNELPEAELKIESSSSANEGGTSTSVTNNNGKVSVKVNGEEVEVPSNGTVTRDGTTITNHTNSTGGNNFSSTTTHSHSTSVNTSNGTTNVQHNHTFNSQ